MKKLYIMLTLIIILVSGKFIYSNIDKNSNKYNNLVEEEINDVEEKITYTDNDVEERIKEFFETTFITKDLSKYNNLLIEEYREDSIDSFAENTEEVKVLEVKKLETNKHPMLKEDVNHNYKAIKNKYKNINFYMIKFDIKYKKNMPSPVDSGIYYSVIPIVGVKNTPLIIPNMHKASLYKGKLTVDS
ncbi:hypothetical protein [Clostridium lundense]|uniref:hypothetical protein n=1 Tax=Clostridium lundense TaxID=319475 RepID=UPI0004848C53|nr:hypothetical protein [Clostridium lundense]